MFPAKTDHQHLYFVGSSLLGFACLRNLFFWEKRVQNSPQLKSLGWHYLLPYRWHQSTNGQQVGSGPAICNLENSWNHPLHNLFNQYGKHKTWLITDYPWLRGGKRNLTLSDNSWPSPTIGRKENVASPSLLAGFPLNQPTDHQLNQWLGPKMAWCHIFGALVISHGGKWLGKPW